MYSFNLVILGIASVSIHDKCNVLRNGTLLEGPYEELMDPPESPFCWR